MKKYIQSIEFPILAPNFVILLSFQIETKAMPDFQTVVEHAQDYIEGKTKTPKVINDLEDVTCRFQSCCMVS